MSPVQRASTVDTLHVRLWADTSPAEGAAWGRRAARSLREVDLDPPDLPPAAILVVRRLADPLPRALLVGEPWQAAATWGQAARSALGRHWRSAGRPAHGAVGSDAEAVWFADPAEWLACLSLDLSRGRAGEYWWWRAWLKHGPATGGLAPIWQAEAVWLPAALALLAERSAGLAVEVVEPLSEAEAGAVRRAVVAAHGLPSALAESGLDLAWCASALPDGGAALPPRRAHAELLALALLVHRAPARARDRRLVAPRPGTPATPAVAPRTDAPETIAPPAGRSAAAEPRTVTAPEARAPDPAAPGAPLDPGAGRPSPAALPPVEARQPGDAPPPRQAVASPAEGPPAPPGAVETRHAPLEPRSPDASEAADVPVAEPALPTAPPELTSLAADTVPVAVDEDGVATALGGIWYLVNLLLALDLLDREDEPLDAWALLRALAAALLQDEPPDPVWAILGDLADEDGGPAVLSRLPSIDTAARAWLAGFEPDKIPALLAQPARLFVTRTHVDLFFRLDQIDLRARLSGLDRDPGWVPALGRVITFHYQ